MELLENGQPWFLKAPRTKKCDRRIKIHSNLPLFGWTPDFAEGSDGLKNLTDRSKPLQIFRPSAGLPTLYRAVDDERIRLRMIDDDRIRLIMIDDNRIRFTEMDNDRIRLRATENDRIRFTEMGNNRIRFTAMDNDRIRFTARDDDRIRLRTTENDRIRFIMTRTIESDSQQLSVIEFKLRITQS
jgi:hypothetical protein